MFDISGFEAGSAAVALTGAVLGWVLRPLFLRDRPTFVAAIAVIAALAALYGLSSEASAVNDARPMPHVRPAASPTPTARVEIVDAPSLCAKARELARANGGSLAGEPARIVARALALDPANPLALSMAAGAAFDERDYDGAIRRWEALAAVLPPDSAQQRDVDEGIASARLMVDAAR